MTMTRYGYDGYGSGRRAKLIGFLVIAALLVFMAKDPVQAAQLAGGLIEGIGTFLQTAIRTVVNH
jgi:hypothetical protein